VGDASEKDFGKKGKAAKSSYLFGAILALSYPGSKAANGVWQRIIGQMPPHDVYVEPFFGSGQVFHRKRPAAISVLNDLDKQALKELLKPINRCQRDHVNMFPGSRLGYVRTLREDGGDLETYILNWCAFELLAQLAEHLPEDSVIYCDPPYPLGTRAGREYYTHEMTDADHSALLSTLKALRCHVLISGYECPLYAEALKDWRCVRYRTRAHCKTVIECLWCNFPEPAVLHDWRYAGNNFRQRTALSRLKRRWLAKLERMRPRQRGYVLNAIKEAYTL